MDKTLLISYFFPPEIGGIQNYLFHLCQGLDSDKIIVLTNKNKESEFNKKQNFKIYRHNFFYPKFAKLWIIYLFFKVLKIIKKDKIKIIQFGHYHELCLTGLFCKVFFNFPYIIYFHGIDLFAAKKNKIKILLFKLITSRAKLLVANSQFTREELIKLEVKKEKIEIITPAVDYRKFDLSKKNEEIIKKYNTDGKRVVLSIGRLEKIKGFDLMIKAIPEILKEIPNLIYLIVGDNLKGDYKRELEDIILKFNLKDKVFFLGEMEDREELKSQYYNLAELVIIPSRQIKYKNYSHVESFGIVSLEAQVMAKPVVVSNIGGLSETIIDKETGISVSAGNEKELAFAVIRILKNENFAYEMGQKGRERIEKDFDWQKRIDKVKNFLVDYK